MNFGQSSSAARLCSRWALVIVLQQLISIINYLNNYYNNQSIDIIVTYTSMLHERLFPVASAIYHNESVYVFHQIMWIYLIWHEHEYKRGDQ